MDDTQIYLPLEPNNHNDVTDLNNGPHDIKTYNKLSPAQWGQNWRVFI